MIATFGIADGSIGRKPNALIIPSRNLRYSFLQDLLNDFFFHLGAGLIRSTDGGTNWQVIARDPLRGKGFYDLKVDPWEMESKHNDPAYAAVKAKLAAALAKLETCKGVGCQVNVGTLPEPGR